jgi:hypothetical protein
MACQHHHIVLPSAKQIGRCQRSSRALSGPLVVHPSSSAKILNFFSRAQGPSFNARRCLSGQRVLALIEHGLCHIPSLKPERFSFAINHREKLL